MYNICNDINKELTRDIDNHIGAILSKVIHDTDGVLLTDNREMANYICMNKKIKLVKCDSLIEGFSKVSVYVHDTKKAEIVFNFSTSYIDNGVTSSLKISDPIFY